MVRKCSTAYTWPWPKTQMKLVVSPWQEQKDGTEAERHHHPMERGLGSALSATT